MPDKLHPVLYRIQQRLRNKQNWTMAIVGRVGSGKSWAALRLAELLDPSFNKHPSHRIMFAILELITKINQEGISTGKVYVLDEASISFSSRASMTSINQEMSHFLQSWRFRQSGLIMTLPDLSFLDIVGRKLIDNVAVCYGYNPTTQICSMRFYDSINDFFRGNPIRVFTRSRKPSGEITKHRYLRVGLASKQTRNVYERMSRKFKKQVSLTAEKNIRDIEEHRQARSYLTELKDTVQRMSKSGVSPLEIAKLTGRPRRTVYDWLKDGSV